MTVLWFFCLACFGLRIMKDTLHRPCMHHHPCWLRGIENGLDQLSQGVMQHGKVCTSVPVSSWMRMSRGGWGTEVISQDAPHTLFMLSQLLLGPFTCTVLMAPRFAASCVRAGPTLRSCVLVMSIKSHCSAGCLYCAQPQLSMPSAPARHAWKDLKEHARASDTALLQIVILCRLSLHAQRQLKCHHHWHCLVTMFQELQACQHAFSHVQVINVSKCFKEQGGPTLTCRRIHPPAPPVLVDFNVHVLGHRACHPAAPQQGTSCLAPA